MNILISGASDLTGRSLVSFLTSQGHSFVSLVRRAISEQQQKIRKFSLERLQL